MRLGHSSDTPLFLVRHSSRSQNHLIYYSEVKQFPDIIAISHINSRKQGIKVDLILSHHRITNLSKYCGSL